MGLYPEKRMNPGKPSMNPDEADETTDHQRKSESIASLTDALNGQYVEKAISQRLNALFPKGMNSERPSIHDDTPTATIPTERSELSDKHSLTPERDVKITKYRDSSTQSETGAQRVVEAFVKRIEGLESTLEHMQNDMNLLSTSMRYLSEYCLARFHNRETGFVSSSQRSVSEPLLGSDYAASFPASSQFNTTAYSPRESGSASGVDNSSDFPKQVDLSKYLGSEEEASLKRKSRIFLPLDYERHSQRLEDKHPFRETRTISESSDKYFGGAGSSHVGSYDTSQEEWQMNCIQASVISRLGKYEQRGEREYTDNKNRERNSKNIDTDGFDGRKKQESDTIDVPPLLIPAQRVWEDNIEVNRESPPSSRLTETYQSSPIRDNQSQSWMQDSRKRRSHSSGNLCTDSIRPKTQRSESAVEYDFADYHVSDSSARVRDENKLEPQNCSTTTHRSVSKSSTRLLEENYNARYTLPENATVLDVIKLWDHGNDTIPPIRKWTSLQKAKQKSKISRWRKIMRIFKEQMNGDMKKFLRAYSDNRGKMLPVSAILAMHKNDDSVSDTDYSSPKTPQNIPAQETSKQELNVDIQDDQETYYVLPRKVNGRQVTPLDIIRIWERGLGAIPPVKNWTPLQKLKQQSKISRWKKIIDIFTIDCKGDQSGFVNKYTMPDGKLMSVSAVIAQHEHESNRETDDTDSRTSSPT